MNTLNSGRVHHLPSSTYRSYSRIPWSKSMHIMPKGGGGILKLTHLHLVILVTLCLKYPKSAKFSNWPFRFQMQACIQSMSTLLTQCWNFGRSLIDGEFDFCLILFFTSQSLIFHLCLDGASWAGRELSKKNVSCSRTQHNDTGEAQTRGLSVSSQAIYH